jgi:hypothetical protein
MEIEQWSRVLDMVCLRPTVLPRPCSKLDSAEAGRAHQASRPTSGKKRTIRSVVWRGFIVLLLRILLPFDPFA